MRVPNIVHFVFGLAPQVEPFHPVHYLAIESCRQVLEPDRILFHHRHEPYGRWWELARPQLELVPAGAAPELPASVYADGLVPERFRYAHVADFVRLDALIAHGGIYADMDTLFVRPFPDELRAHPFVIGREDPVRDERTGERRASLCNALMAAEPGSAYARVWRERMADALNGTWSNHSGFLADELAEELPGEVHVEPKQTFFPFGHTQQGLEALLERSVEVDGAVSIHLWAHLWWDPHRRDFSDVHALALTAPAIRTHDTTYNRLARRFLPPVGTLELEAGRLGRLAYHSLNHTGGYDEAGRRLMLALDAAGVDVAYAPMMYVEGGEHYAPLPPDERVHPLVDRLVAPTEEAGVVVGHLTPEFFPRLRSQYPDAGFVGHTVWETDRLPRHWPELLELPDVLVVPCQWNADTIAAGGVTTPVAVVPHAATVPARRQTATWTDIPDDVFVFYTVALWTARKAIWLTIRAYLEAFRAGEPVLLVVKTSAWDGTYRGPGGGPRHAGPGTSAWAAASVIKDHPQAAPVKLVTRELGEEDMQALHTRGDCFVSLCRSEGWGIPAFDAAAYGNPVVITGYGGQLDYLDAASAELVEYELVSVDDPLGFPSFSSEQLWAEPSIAHAAERLRWVFEHRDDAVERAGALSQRLLRTYSPEVVAEAFVRVCGAAAGGPALRSR
jgi:glycosyltransferase involved in cell wall biosynthesis